MKLFPSISNLELLQIVFTYSSIQILSEKFGSQIGSRFQRSSHILAAWTDQEGNVKDSFDIQPSKILRFISVSFTVHSATIKATLAQVKCFKMHAFHQHFGRGLRLWYHDTFVPSGPSSYIPVQRIYKKFAPAIGSFLTSASSSRRSVLFVCPLPFQKYF